MGATAEAEPPNPLARWLDAGGPGRKWAVCAALALLYVVSGCAGLKLASYQENATLIWPPSGIALAALLLGGARLWPGVFVGALLVNLRLETPLAPTLGIALGHTLEPLVGAWLLRRWTPFDPAFARMTDVLWFGLLGGLVCTLVSACLGVGSLAAAGMLAGRSIPFTALTWWLGDAGGALVLAPLILVGVQGAPRLRHLLKRQELWWVLALLGGSTALSFTGVLAPGWPQLLMVFVPFPLCVWAGLRLGPRGSVAASFLTACVATLGTAKGFGPFEGYDAHQSLLLLWAYVTSLGMVALLLAAAVAERDTAEARVLEVAEERRRLELKMERAQRLEGLEILAGGVAHDFNNLLTAIFGTTDLLRRELPDSEQHQQSLDCIVEASTRASELCRRLLTYAGRDQHTPTSFQLAPLWEETRSLLEVTLSRSIRIEANLEAAPALLGDPSQIRQLLMNLVLNAAEALGDRPGTIQLVAREDRPETRKLSRSWVNREPAKARFVRLEVRDDGPGLELEISERIFDPFFSTKGPGRGLGMSTVLGIVKSHGGAIDVQSEPGEGTTFRVWLPAGRLAKALPSAPPTPVAMAGTLLLADDEPMILKTVSLLLEGEGWTVLTAKDGEEALELFGERREAIDVALLDVRMPKRSGVEVLAELRRLKPSLPVILTTGYDAGQLEGVSGVPTLDKPFELSALLQTLALVLTTGASATSA